MSKDAKKLFGWIPPSDRTLEQAAAHESIVAAMPRFGIRGKWQMNERRYSLWAAAKKLSGKHLEYIWQQTGSCVGAGGCNMLMTLMTVEIAVGNEPEQFLRPWWLYTYGQSRLRAGMRGEGDGSLGSSWAEAITKDGIFEIDPQGHDLPDFQVKDGWLVQPAGTERKWSAGERHESWCKDLGKKHLVKTAAPIRSSDEAVAALANGYPLTSASMFGWSPMVPSPQGNPPVRVATYSDSWAHQMYFDEAWDHPSLGLLFRQGNNWGNVHGEPTGEEPAGGVYITAKTFDSIARERGSEIYAFSAFDGFPGRAPDIEKLSWYI